MNSHNEDWVASCLEGIARESRAPKTVTYKSMCIYDVWKKAQKKHRRFALLSFIIGTPTIVILLILLSSLAPFDISVIFNSYSFASILHLCGNTTLILSTMLAMTWIFLRVVRMRHIIRNTEE